MKGRSRSHLSARCYNLPYQCCFLPSTIYVADYSHSAFTIFIVHLFQGSSSLPFSKSCASKFHIPNLFKTKSQYPRSRAGLGLSSLLLCPSAYRNYCWVEFCWLIALICWLSFWLTGNLRFNLITSQLWFRLFQCWVTHIIFCHGRWWQRFLLWSWAPMRVEGYLFSRSLNIFI